MALLIFLIFGLVVGALARFIVPGRENGGWILSLAFGVAGAYLGGYLGQLLGFQRTNQPMGFVMSLVGAVLLVIAYHAFTRRTAS